MRVYDFFSGKEGFSQAFKDRGHEVFTIDFNKKFKPDMVADMMEVEPDMLPFKPDIILASPPCNCYSVASLYRYWVQGLDGKPYPKSPKTVKSIALVYHTLYLIHALEPKYWFLENPRGMLRNVIGKPRTTITQCKYGASWQKPTDLWGVFPEGMFWRAMCSPGDSCHEKAERGDKSGVQGQGGVAGVGGGGCSAMRAKLPYELSLSICLACEGKNITNLNRYALSHTLNDGE